MKPPGHTPPFRGPDGAILPDSIAEIGYLRLGGLDQWVMIRGENLGNPLLVLLHGGPGMPETFFFRQFNAPLEKAFTVVYWEQRGAGKSFDRAIPRSSMTVEQFVADLGELVDAVCARVGRRKVVLFGHSWGSAFGTIYAARFPERVAVYVGSGQYGDAQAGEAASYAYALSEAERVGHQRALRALRAIGPPPHSAKSLWVERRWVSRLEGLATAGTIWKTARLFLEGPERSVLDARNLFRGFRFSIDAMWDEVSRINLIATAPALRVPAFFFLGRRDHWVPPEASVAYFNALSAPAKALVWFEKSGHEPFADEAERFNESMLNLVRPLAS